ncbi:MAG: hypothetical protein GY925_16750, partial [Actinomycetia bacterium]|nr:hypothetical protein [Actinomycetes bacterium]
QLSCEWVTKLYHNSHVHEYPADTSCTTSTTIAGLGCGDEAYHWEVELTITDPAGLSDFAKVALYPDCAGTGNQPPVAVPDSTSVTTGLSVTIDVLQNDSDDIGLDESSVSIVSPPGHGTISDIDPVTGAITYTNNGDASPTDTFSYQVLDIAGLPSNSAAVDVTISSAPDTTPPTDPSNLVATPLSYHEISLSWTGSTDAGGSGLAGYNIYRDGGATPIATVAGTTHTDGGLIANTAYTYQVSAIDGADNESGLSNSAGATTPPQPISGIVSGFVRDAVTLLPIEDAVVTLQATTTHTSTAADGSFALNIADGGTDLVIVGANKGYYSASVTTNSPAAGAEILLNPVIIGTNAAYSFVEPATCAGCHPNQKSEWDNSAMANAGVNTWMHDIYDGNGTPGGMGGFVYTRDSVHAATVPDAECAACHQPESWVAAGYSGRVEGPDDIGFPSTAASHGVSCEACHKIADIDTQKMDFPGIFPGAVEFNLPEWGTQVQYGLLPDVDFHAPGTMEASYQPQLVAEVCGACHQDNADPNEDHTFTGITSEPTFNEWLQSPYGNDPSSPSYTTCIDCHMPPSGETEICTVDPL